MTREYKSKKIFIVILISVILFFSLGCTSLTHYFIENSSDQNKSIEVHFKHGTLITEENQVPPDSLLLTTKKEFPNKPHKWYKHIDKKKVFSKINDSIYKFDLLPHEKLTLPDRIASNPSIRKIIINQHEEIIFKSEVENTSEKYFEGINLNQGTSILYNLSIFNAYYEVKFRN